jgi:hypothetical protein
LTFFLHADLLQPVASVFIIALISRCRAAGAADAARLAPSPVRQPEIPIQHLGEKI